MNSITTAINITDQLVDLLPTARLSYEYQEYFDMHMIEVLPLSVYNSVAFEGVAEPFLMEFIGQFPGESLCFVSEESLYSVEHSMHTAEGKEYHSPSTLYRATKPSAIAKKKVKVRIDPEFFKKLSEKISASSNIDAGESEYAMAA